MRNVYHNSIFTRPFYDKNQKVSKSFQLKQVKMNLRRVQCDTLEKGLWSDTIAIMNLPKMHVEKTYNWIMGGLVWNVLQYVEHREEGMKNSLKKLHWESTKCVWNRPKFGNGRTIQISNGCSHRSTICRGLAKCHQKLNRKRQICNTLTAYHKALWDGLRVVKDFEKDDPSIFRKGVF